MINKNMALFCIVVVLFLQVLILAIPSQSLTRAWQHKTRVYATDVNTPGTYVAIPDSHTIVIKVPCSI